MISHRRWESLDKADFGWLRARYHFQVNPEAPTSHRAIGPLIVWNDDEIAVGAGFPLHGHRDMEIITYVRQGQRHPSAIELDGARHQGELIAKTANKLFG